MWINKRMKEMKTIKTNVAIIGAGSAGLSARRAVEEAGKDWVLIEAGELGTTCARVGCMPSKLLIAAAEAAHDVKMASAFGVMVEEGSWHVDAKAVFERVRSERDRFVGFVVENIEELDQSKVLRERARFLDATTLQVGEETRVEADAVVIATGSSPFIPPVFEDVREHIMISDDVFELDVIPEKLAVIGAGIIGLELGQALGRLGSKVHVFNNTGDLGLFSDEIVRDAALEIFSQEMSLSMSVEITRAERLGDGRLKLTWDDEQGGSHHDSFSHVLVAAGRRPNTSGMGLEELDIPRDEKDHIIVPMDTLQLGELPLFMAGDANNKRPLLHEASDEGRIAGRNASSFPKLSDSFRSESIAVAFTSPQMAFVGKPWKDLDPKETAVGQVSYANQGRARVMLVNQGVVRLYADRESCRLVGGELLGPAMEHMAHLLTWVIQSRMRVLDLLRLPFYHPVLEEGLRTALRALAEDLHTTSECPPEHFALSVGG